MSHMQCRNDEGHVQNIGFTCMILETVLQIFAMIPAFVHTKQHDKSMNMLKFSTLDSSDNVCGHITVVAL